LFQEAHYLAQLPIAGNCIGGYPNWLRLLRLHADFSQQMKQFLSRENKWLEALFLIFPLYEVTPLKKSCRKPRRNNGADLHCPLFFPFIMAQFVCHSFIILGHPFLYINWRESSNLIRIPFPGGRDQT
jgi:hypothetical protein